MTTADIGLIGLAVMGQNLVLNMNDHDFTVAVFNRTTSKVDNFMAGPAQNTKIIGCYSIKELVDSLKKPRRVMLMVKAGPVVDIFIKALTPMLEPGDIIIDGGNSLFTDSQRREQELKQLGILYLGTGISGGEEGARHGPSIMPGGNPKAWPKVQDIFQTIAAKVDNVPCCDWVGQGGSGHFVKMVHNGIEYGDMQLICEAYDFMSRGLKMDADQIGEIFSRWNKGVLDSYLIEISAEILKYKDSDGSPLLEKILDTAGQKGTGKWTGINALDMGIPLTLIGEAVFARCLSALKDERLEAAKILHGPKISSSCDQDEYINFLQDALYGAKIISYAQGYMLMRQAAKEHGWNLNYGGIALMWRGGCIIRSAFLANINHAFTQKPDLSNLLLDDFFSSALQKSQQGWRMLASKAIEIGIPIPAIGAGLAYYDGYRSARLPASFLQAQRDYFGAHTYERTDKPRGEFFHTDWTGRGGIISSSTYEV